MSNQKKQIDGPERLVPAGAHRVEIQVVNSRFITTVRPAFSVEAAREFIKEVREEMPDASHHVPAFIIGHGNAIQEGCQDDGEPSGTAGRPALSVLRGSGIGDIAVVVTRYFGGTRLGKGGLVRAYQDSVRAALESLPLAHKTSTHTLSFKTAYPFYERARQIVEEFEGQILEEIFTEAVTLTARFGQKAAEAFIPAIFDRSNGTVAPEIIESSEETIVPVPKNANA